MRPEQLAAGDAGAQQQQWDEEQPLQAQQQPQQQHPQQQFEQQQEREQQPQLQHPQQQPKQQQAREQQQPPQPPHQQPQQQDQGGAAGMPDWAADARQYVRVEEWFQALVRRHFLGALKPPINEEARAQAGFGPEWYLPLVATPASAAVVPRATAPATI